jgi:hypothetical protein
MSGEGLSAEEREALSASIDRDDLPGLYQPMIEAVERIVARRESEAAEKALRDAADAWTQGQWSDVMLPKPTPPAVPVIAYSNRIGDWLRARADSVAQGREEGGK